jgi:hypothetical protein
MGRRLKNDPDRRMDNVVIMAAASFPEDDLALLDRALLPGWIEALKEAEASTRRLRYRLESLAEDQARQCRTCGGPVVGRRDRVYCSHACRQRMHRERND